MPRVDNVRERILGLIRARPFQKFVLNLENRDRVLIEHPENVAFDPNLNSKNTDLSIITGKVRLWSSFDAVTSVVKADRNGAAAR